MIIRNERPSDIEVITDITVAAFEACSFSEQTEHKTIHDLRLDGALSLSLVAEIDGRVVGHIAFSSVTISDGTLSWHGLGPVSVMPDYQGRGIGTKMVNRGLDLLKSMGSNGCALVGLPTYYRRFGFRNHARLIHEGVPQEVFVAKSFSGQVPCGTLEFHQAFKQLSVTEKEAVGDAIIDFEIGGIRLDPENPAVENLIKKQVLTQTSGGKFMISPMTLAAYDSYFAKVFQFRATEMSRGHKNPILAAIKMNG